MTLTKTRYASATRHLELLNPLPRPFPKGIFPATGIPPLWCSIRFQVVATVVPLSIDKSYFSEAGVKMSENLCKSKVEPREIYIFFWPQSNLMKITLSCPSDITVGFLRTCPQFKYIMFSRCSPMFSHEKYSDQGIVLRIPSIFIE